MTAVIHVKIINMDNLSLTNRFFSALQVTDGMWTKRFDTHFLTHLIVTYQSSTLVVLSEPTKIVFVNMVSTFTKRI